MIRTIRENSIQIIKENAGKLTAYQMAELANVVPSTIRKYASELGITVEMPERVKKRGLVERLIKEHGHEMTAREIAKQFNVPAQTVWHKAWKLGIPLKKNRIWGKPNKKRPDPGKYFNEKAHEDWLVG